jgi:hypothetical protein
MCTFDTMKSKNMREIQVGDRARVAPQLTNGAGWRSGIVIDTWDNPFRGREVALKDNTETIYFGEEEFFELAESEA